VEINNLEAQRLQHNLAIAHKNRAIENLTEQIGEIEGQYQKILSQNAKREAFVNFVTIHSRALTYAVVNRDRRLTYKRSLGSLLRGYDWNFEDLERRHEASTEYIS
jgi:hypothetical protein